jgi:hypothetical protein
MNFKVGDILAWEGLKDNRGSMNKSLLELKGSDYVALCKKSGYQEWWDFHPCIYCRKPFLEHIEESWGCYPRGYHSFWKPMDNLSYVEWLNAQNNSRIS